MSVIDPDGKIAALHRRALISVVSVVERMQLLQAMGAQVSGLDGNPQVAKKAIACFREYSDACVESGAAVRKYCDHMEPLLEEDE